MKQTSGQTPFNQPRRRKAEFIKPPNILKAKVGSGGLADEILEKAQTLLENSNVDFPPLADIYLQKIQEGIRVCERPPADKDAEYLISLIIYPAMQLKANGGMFKYELVTNVANTLIQFLEAIETLDEEAVEVVRGFYTTIRAIVQGKISGDGGQHGKELHSALDKACHRYFEKYQDNIRAADA